MHRLDRQSQMRAGMIIAVYSERQECNCEVDAQRILHIQHVLPLDITLNV